MISGLLLVVHGESGDVAALPCLHAKGLWVAFKDRAVQGEQAPFSKG